MRLKILGVTLLELMITLAIISIILMGAGQGFYQLYTHIQSQLFSSQLMHVIDLARTEAIARNEPVKLERSADLSLILTAHHIVLYRFPNKIHSGQLHWRAFPQEFHDLTFLPEGVTNFQNGSFWFCRAHTAYPDWVIYINKMGRVRMVMSNKKENLC